METEKIALTPENLPDFLSNFRGLHDASILVAYYNIIEKSAGLELEIIWGSDLRLEHPQFEGKRGTRLVLFFEGVLRFNFTEIESVDYIPDIFFKHITENYVDGTFWTNKPVFIFAIGEDFDHKENVFLNPIKPSRENFIVCEKVWYSVTEI